MLLKYFHPLEQGSESMSQRNIFWTTAEALFGSEQHTGGLDRQTAKPIIAKAIKQVFDLAAWPCVCPDVLSECADLLIMQSTDHSSAPLGFAIITSEDSLEALKAYKSSVPGHGHAAARLVSACTPGRSSNTSARKASRAAGNKSAACPDGHLSAFQKRLFLQLALLPLSCPSKVRSILEASAVGKAFVQQVFLDAEPSHAQQASVELTVTDMRAIDTLAQIHSCTSILADCGWMKVVPVYLPSGVALQRLVEVETDQLDTLSMNMHVYDRLSELDAAPIMESPPPAIAADMSATSSCNSSRQCLHPDARPAKAEISAGAASDQQNLGQSAADNALPASAATPEAEQLPEVSSHTLCAQDECAASGSESACAHAAASGPSGHEETQTNKQLLGSLRISQLIRIASVSSRSLPESVKTKLKQVAGSSMAAEPCRDADAAPVVPAGSAIGSFIPAEGGKMTDGRPSSADALPSLTNPGACDSSGRSAARRSRHANDNSTEQAKGLRLVYRLMRPLMHDLVERQFAIAALVATIQGQYVQSISRRNSDGTCDFYIHSKWYCKSASIGDRTSLPSCS